MCVELSFPTVMLSVSYASFLLLLLSSESLNSHSAYTLHPFIIHPFIHWCVQTHMSVGE